MKESQSNQHDTIVRGACAWLAQLETGELSSADIGAFREWVDSNPLHGAEMKRLAELSADMGMLLVLDDPMLEDATELHKGPALQHLSEIENSNQSSRSRPLLWVSGLAASLLVAVLVTLTQFQATDTNGPVTTPIGGYLEKELEDGTVVRLNTDTGLTVAYDNDLRKITLHKGEAYFQVAHDTDRPLVVSTDTREVVALGTAFSVRLQDKHMKVLVTEGRIAIRSSVTGQNQQGSPAGGARPSDTVAEAMPGRVGAPILLEAGQAFDDQIRIGGHPVTNVDEGEQQRSLAWQRGLAEFTDTPLAEVVSEVSRYTRLTINVEHDIQNVKFGGIFPTGEPNLLFEALETSYGISVTYLDESTVLLADAASRDMEKPDR
ncbi:FecR domain-containing protein [Gammaproteobacteria bacterium]|nr:FecR domain-containing protein [Gammaproteobacteria bacterium]